MSFRDTEIIKKVDKCSKTISRLEKSHDQTQNFNVTIRVPNLFLFLQDLNAMDPLRKIL